MSHSPLRVNRSPSTYNPKRTKVKRSIKITTRNTHDNEEDDEQRDEDVDMRDEGNELVGGDDVYDPKAKKKKKTPPMTSSAVHSIVNSGLIFVLFVLVGVVFLTQPGTTQPVIPPPNVRMNSVSHEKSFTLIPSEGSMDKHMVLSPLILDYDTLQTYDLCCYKKNGYVCRMVMKNMGVDAVIEKSTEGKIYGLIVIQHPDMIGARCKLFWTEKKNTEPIA